MTSASLPLLAFGFATPMMLWGVALGAIPVVIHLLYRQRYRETPWAAMQFLSAAIRKHAQRMRLEQWLLLAIRTAILLLVALALAGPSWESLSTLVSADHAEPTHRILVLDASLSMSLTENGRSRFNSARETARKLIQSSRPGDVWSLVRISGVSPKMIIRKPSPQTEAVLQELEQLTCLEEVGDLAQTFQNLDQLLQSGVGPSRKEIFLITDLQMSNWQQGEASPPSKLRKLIAALPAETLHVCPVGSGDTPNTAITTLSVSEGLHLANQPLDIQLQLKHYGSQAWSTSVELRVDDRLQESRSIMIPAGAEITVDWSPTLTAGEHRLEAKLKDDGLRADNVRRAVVTIRDRLPVLLVNGKPSGEPWENATDLLKTALASDEKSPFAVTVIPESELLSTPLSAYACVFLCNLALITEREANWLSEYLTPGGAVVFCMGGQVRVDQYNQVLLQRDRPLLPAKLGELMGQPKTADTSFEFDPEDFSHPILKPFQGNPNSGLELTKIFAYLKTEIPTDRGTQVALLFNTGDPAILSASFGSGRVVLITTSVDREWGTWAVWGHSFIPMIHELVRFAAADRLTNRQLLVGQPLAVMTDSDAVRSAVLHLPNAETVNLIPLQRQFSYDQTVASGFYRLEADSPTARTTWTAINIDPTESDPTIYDEKLFKAEFPETANWKFHFDPPSIMTNVAAISRESATQPLSQPATQSWSRSLLLFAFWLLLSEQALAWRFSLGLTMLSAGLAVSLVQFAGSLSGSMTDWFVRCLAAGMGVLVVQLWERKRRRSVRV